jgi:DnaK suppressor protein
MDPETLQPLQHRLESMVVELSEALEDRTGSTAPVQLDGSIGRLSRMDAIQSQGIAIGLKRRQQQALLRVQGALEAIRRGTYGHCRRCRDPIAVERLEAQPDAVLCFRCAEKAGR